MRILKSDFIRLKLFPYIAFYIIKFINVTVRIKYINRNILDEALNSGKKIIFAFWHGRQFLLVNAHRNLNIVLMTSTSQDGELQTKILSLFGYKFVRGSSSKNSIAALRSLIREINNGMNSALAVDGPKGPVYKVKEGIFFAASITGAIIIPVSSSAKPAKVFEKAWDKYLLPLPFSKCSIAYGLPIIVNKEDNFDLLAVKLERTLNELTYICDQEVK